MEAKSSNSKDFRDSVVKFFDFIGEDSSREGLLETPERVIRACDELFSGYKTNPEELFKTFQDGCCQEMVILKDVEYFSFCEHHLLPFFGKVSVGYIPNGKVVGVSKIARVVDMFAKRLQIQERMTSQIADTIIEHINPAGVMVVCEGTHFCMVTRGVRKQKSKMVTSAIRGVFKENGMARDEFLTLLKG